MSEKMTQNKAILNHLEKYGSITPAEAWAMYGCMRLGARIHDLRAAGVAIKTDTVTMRGKYGGITNYARYTLNANK